MRFHIFHIVEDKTSESTKEQGLLISTYVALGTPIGNPGEAHGVHATPGVK